jgi:hypothetical protein
VKASGPAIKARLAQVGNCLATLPGDVRCSDVDADRVEGFRRWAAKQPIVTPAGKQKERSLSTIENSVLSAARGIMWRSGLTWWWATSGAIR